MKRNFTLFIALTMAIISHAQTTHNISVQNNTFNPSTLTIDVGDEVVWTNVQGSHNVNGTAISYPDNPEEFGNSVGAGWTYSFTFTLSGTYDFHCDPHQVFGMTGVINVLDPTVGIEEYSLNDFSIFPSPAKDQITLRLGEYDGDVEIIIIDLKGSIVKAKKITLNKGQQSISIAELSPSIYFLKVIENNNQIVRKFIVE